MVGFHLPHIVKTTLSDGREATYIYAFRGGPRMKLPLDHPDFEAVRQEMCEQYRVADGLRVARERIKRESDKFKDGGGRVHSVTAVATKLVQNARMRAARRKVPCDLTVPFVIDMLHDQGLVCSVSGLPFDLAFNLEKTHSRNLFAPSIDRISAKSGYVRGNVRIVLVAVNYGINEWGFDAYVRICRAVAERSAQQVNIGE